MRHATHSTTEADILGYDMRRHNLVHAVVESCMLEKQYLAQNYVFQTLQHKTTLFQKRRSAFGP